MLKTFNQFLQRWMPLITPLSVVIGVALSDWLIPLEYLVPWIFAFMTFAGSLGSNFSDLKKVMLHPLPLFICLLILHIVMPVICFGVGSLVFYDEPYFVTGLILAFLVPTGITSLIWVSVYKGNIVLTLSIVLIDMFLAPFLVPAILNVFVGSSVNMDGVDMMIGLLWMVVIPSVLGMALNQMTKGKVNEQLAPNLAPFSKIGLGAVVMINSSQAASYFLNINWQLVLVGVVVFLLAALGYVLGWFASKALKANQDTAVTLIFNSGMRNISTGAVIAITYFPAAVIVPVVMSMLFQQVLASLSGGLLDRLYSITFNRNVSQIEQ
ncbi:bile acid:sodium symporter family protein [Salinibacillus xinjiangensis]|uniref:Bile acid:sodium symporter family protein n=1 Tax=Salinibacillus xinjiangensis TaxID=1229268 RepID=A0A6G1X5Z8_9BACI|nr:bile acid:sodium symporter family protein [Salinibacillus xinjiangensis]MRG86362.1 bile acid:sodium symporter family protein [Salinibacillus xinjiangensis]